LDKLQKFVGEDMPEIKKIDLKSSSSTQIIIGSPSGEDWKLTSNPSFVTVMIEGKHLAAEIHSLKVSSDMGRTWISLMESNGGDSSFRLSGQFKMGDFNQVLISVSSNENFHGSFKIDSIQVCEWW
jgi:hypothetical protein